MTTNQHIGTPVAKPGTTTKVEVTEIGSAPQLELPASALTIPMPFDLSMFAQPTPDANNPDVESVTIRAFFVDQYGRTLVSNTTLSIGRFTFQERPQEFRHAFEVLFDMLGYYLCSLQAITVMSTVIVDEEQERAATARSTSHLRLAAAGGRLIPAADPTYGEDA